MEYFSKKDFKFDENGMMMNDFINMLDNIFNKSNRNRLKYKIHDLSNINTFENVKKEWLDTSNRGINIGLFANHVEILNGNKDI